MLWLSICILINFYTNLYKAKVELMNFNACYVSDLICGLGSFRRHLLAYLFILFLIFSKIVYVCGHMWDYYSNVLIIFAIFYSRNFLNKELRRSPSSRIINIFNDYQIIAIKYFLKSIEEDHCLSKHCTMAELFKSRILPSPSTSQKKLKLTKKMTPPQKWN